MTADNVFTDVAGGPDGHIPVMLNEVLDCLRPAPSMTVIDGTFGAGGYTSAILLEGASVIAIDRDPDAISGGARLAKAWPETLFLVHGEFENLDAIAQGQGTAQVDGVVLDIGVSSMQLDQGERGFSFRQDGPLDMRMAQTGVSAADVVNFAQQKDLTRIIGLLGEERKASFISREIVRARTEGPISTTGQLAAIVERVIHRRAGDRIHPATRTFQALRIFINRELLQLSRALFAAERILREGGRLVVVTFHSLEDRIVKQFFKDRSFRERGSRHLPDVNNADATFRLERNGLVKPGETECEANPRSRSAKLRWGIRTGVQAPNADMAIFGLPTLPDPAGFAQKGVF